MTSTTPWSLVCRSCVVDCNMKVCGHFWTPDIAYKWTIPDTTPLVNRCHVWNSFWRHVWRQKAAPLPCCIGVINYTTSTNRASTLTSQSMTNTRLCFDVIVITRWVDTVARNISFRCMEASKRFWLLTKHCCIT